ncbi:MAG: hypothetical protein KKE24_03775 [Candidatus Thermoplasmatota archaeon]|nr:hypothetical protein [Candidatus Thermoplasmatota archaeon]
MILRIYIASIAAIGGITAFSSSVLAYPANMPQETSVFIFQILIVLAIIFPINLLLYSALLRVLSLTVGDSIGRLPGRARQFAWSIVLTVLISSSLVALVYTWLSISWYDLYGPADDGLRIFYALIASAMIFIAYLVPTHFLVGLKKRINVIIAGVIALINPILWYLMDTDALDWGTLISYSFLAIFLDILLIAFLVIWHEQRYLSDPSRAEYSPRIIFRASISYFGVLAVVLILMFAMLINDDDEHYSSTPTTQLTRALLDTEDGWKFTLSAVSIDTRWTEIDILISDGTYSDDWTNISTKDLDDGSFTTKNYGAASLNTLTVFMNMTDISGNGYVNQGDYFALTANAFANTTTYTVILIYAPTASEMARMTFSGP